MQYVSGRKINQDFGVPGITTNDTVVNVDGRIAVGIGTSATADVDLGSIRIREALADSTGFTGEIGYFLTKDSGGLIWTAVPPLNNNAIFVAEDGDIIGVSSFTGINIQSNSLSQVSVSTNTSNSNFADLSINFNWVESENGGLYTSRNIGIGTTVPNVALDVVGNGNFTGIISATSFIGEFNVDTKDLNVSGIASFTGTTDNVIGDTNTGIVQIDGGVGIDKNVSIGASLFVNNSLTVGTAVTISNGIVSATTFDGKFLDVKFLNVTGIATINTGIVTNLNVSGISTLGTVKINAGIVTSTTGTAVSFFGNLTGTASTASFATTAFNLGGDAASNLNVAFATTAGIATNVIGGIASVTSLSVSGVSGISTLGTVKIAAGIITSTTGIVTYYGDGSNLTGVSGGIGINSNGENIGTGFTTLNFIGTGNAFAINGNILDISINSSESAGFAQTAGIATNLANGVGGQVVYQSAADTTAFLPNGTVGQVLISNGGTNAPQWANATSSGAIDGITIQDEGSIVGSGGSITALNFVGNGVVATASGSISTITISQSVNGSGGIANTATNVIGGIASVTSLSVSGISTLGTVKISAGIITSTTGTAVSFFGNLTGTASTASFATTAFSLNGVVESDLNVAFAQTAGIATETTRLQTARTFEITGDIIASPISFNGTGNVSLAATIQPNSVALGNDTTGDYVESISGTGNQITVTAGTGEGSTPTISIPDNPTLPGTTVTIANDLQVNRNLNVDGNITIGGTSATLFTETLKISDPDIIVGFRTDAAGNDISNDTTASHGGIAVASTEGSPLVSFIGGGGTVPATYKKIFWFKSGAFTGLATDAWLTNYAFGVGTTSMSAGTKFAVGNIETDFDDIKSVRNINASGIVTATGGFLGNLTGTASTASFATTAFTLNNRVESEFNVATAVTATNLANAANITTGTISDDRLGGPYTIDIVGSASTASFATTAFTLNNRVESDFNVATAVTATNLADAANITTGTISDDRLGGPYTIDIVGSASTASFATTAFTLDGRVESEFNVAFAQTAGIATNVIGGIASVTSLSVSGVSTLGTVKIDAGIVTATSGIVTYYGDGANLINLTGASAATYGDATNVAQVTVDANGRITGISNVAISGGGGGDTYQFNTGVTSSISLAATGIGITALTLPSTAGKQYTIYSINASNVATGNTEVNFIGAFDFSGGERSYFAYNIPVPTGLSIEALKQPQILNPSDRITIRSTDFDRNGADDIIDVYITYKEETSSDYFGVGVGTVGIAVTTNIGIYTSTTYPSVVQSIRVANRTDVGGKPISIAISNGIRTTYLIDNLIVPKYASIELLETPKRLNTNDVIEVQVDETETIDIQISGKKITS